MTTICYRNGVLAADTQLTLGNLKVFCSKIARLRPEFIISCAGDVDQEYVAHKFWTHRNWRQMELPKIPPKENEDDEKITFNAIFIEDGVAYFCMDSFVPVPLEHPFLAIGSGQDIAMSGMHLGLTAQQAVLLASELDINTNDTVDYYDPKDQQIKRYVPK